MGAKVDVPLKPRELRFLKLIYPDGTVAVGLTIGHVLRRRGYIEVDGRTYRFRLTAKGRKAVEEQTT